MAARLLDPSFRAVDSLGSPISGAKLYIYEAGTSTPIDTYTTTALTGGTENPNPVVSGATGLFPDMFCAADDYKVIFKDASDNTLDTWDDINISSAASFSSGINAAGYSEHLINAQTGTTYTYLTGDRAKKVTHTNIASIAATLPQANGTTFAAGWYITVINQGAGLLTVTPTTSTIGGESTLVLTRGQSAEIISDGTNYSVEIKGEPVGSRKTWYSSTPPYGWLFENGDSIGSLASGATKAAAKYRALYAHLYGAITDTYAAVSSGRGADANTDFDANKTLTMPTMANKSEYGVGTAAAGETAGATTVTSTGSITVNAVTLSQSNLPAVQLGAGFRSANNANTTGAFIRGNQATGSGAGGVTTDGNTAAIECLTQAMGSGTSFTPTGSFTGGATSVLHPIRGTYWIIKY